MESPVTTQMSRDQFDDWVLTQYQALVAMSGKDGMKREDALGTIVGYIAAAVAKGDVVLPLDIEAMVGQVIHGRDERARRSQVDHVQFVVDCINGATILGEDDPIMDQVCLAGDGLRKLWRHVGIDDLTAMVGVKTQHAADASVAANEFQQRVQIIIRHIVANHGVDGTLGDIV